MRLVKNKKVWRPSKYVLYENSVQDAADDAQILYDLYKQIKKKKPRHFREDFCGTYKIACEWVKIHKNNTAIGLDIDPEPLAYGKEHHWENLTADQKLRVSAQKKNVMSVTNPKADLIAACNFSYWIFKDRKTLIKYFKNVHKSLKKDGLFFMDIVGGTEMVEEHTDEEKHKVGNNRFTYIWKLEKYNPVTNEGFFSISYKLPDGKHLKRAFTYDWRVWTIQEIRECLEEAGFKKSAVYWEQDDEDGDGTGEFLETKEEENCEVWIAYIAASP